MSSKQVKYCFDLPPIATFLKLGQMNARGYSLNFDVASSLIDGVKEVLQIK